MSSYQGLNKYKGSLYGEPFYNGIEFDFEVPDNLVVSSPGGLSTTQHHYTKGFYGEGASSWDIYGGEGQRYPYAEHGNLYAVGHNAPQQQHEYSQYPPDMMYPQQGFAREENDLFPPGPFQVGSAETLVPTLSRRRDFENFTPVNLGSKKKSKKSVEFITPPDSSETTEVPGSFKSLHQVVTFPNPLYLFIVIILLYMALDFWVRAGEGFVMEKFHRGNKPTWKALIIYGLVLTAVVILITSLIGLPFVKLEEASE